MKKILLIFQLIIVIYSVDSIADDEEGAKAIFYGGNDSPILHTSEPSTPDTSPKLVSSKKVLRSKTHKSNSNQPSSSTTQEYAGIKYWIELERDGKLQRVSPTYSFRSGDRFKIGVVTKQDGYLYLVNTGTTGQTHILYPSQSSNDDGFVKASTPYLFPLKAGMMRFDNNPGEEIFKIALSPVPLRESNNSQVSNESSNDFVKVSSSSPVSPCGSKDIFVEDSCEQSGSKDIFVEEDQSGDSRGMYHPAAYVVAPVSYMQQGNPILKTLKLKHQ